MCGSTPAVACISTRLRLRRPGGNLTGDDAWSASNVGNYRFRFSSSYLPPYVVDFDIMMKDDLSKPDVKLGSLWLGTASWVLDDGELGIRAEVLPHLRQGSTLGVYSTDRDSVLRWQIEGGDKAVTIPDRLPSVLGREGRRKHR